MGPTDRYTFGLAWATLAVKQSPLRAGPAHAPHQSRAVINCRLYNDGRRPGLEARTSDVHRLSVMQQIDELDCLLSKLICNMTENIFSRSGFHINMRDNRRLGGERGDVSS